MNPYVRLAAVLALSGLQTAGGAQAQGDGEATAPPPALRLPIACHPGTDCFIQQYADHDAGPGARDYRCGPQSYDGHKGVDIRLPTIAMQRRGVDVLAAQDGQVLALRDEIEDSLMTGEMPEALKGKECGNGVLIAHAAGWTTQYCHMAKGSIAVTVGQQVKAGARLGQVGLSGQTQFPHLHVTVRHGEDVVDPFAPSLAADQCGDSSAQSLWDTQARSLLAYRPAQIINAGFGSAAVVRTDIEEERVTPPVRGSDALTFYMRAIGLRKDDMLRIHIDGPDGQAFATHELRMDGDKAEWLIYTGRATKDGGPAPGRYRATGVVIRSGQAIARVERSLKI